MPRLWRKYHLCIFQIWQRQFVSKPKRMHTLASQAPSVYHQVLHASACTTLRHMSGEAIGCSADLAMHQLRLTFFNNAANNALLDAKRPCAALALEIQQNAIKEFLLKLRCQTFARFFHSRFLIANHMRHFTPLTRQFTTHLSILALALPERSFHFVRLTV